MTNKSLIISAIISIVMFGCTIATCVNCFVIRSDVSSLLENTSEEIVCSDTDGVTISSGTDREEEEETIDIELYKELEQAYGKLIQENEELQMRHSMMLKESEEEIESLKEQIGVK